MALDLHRVFAGGGGAGAVAGQASRVDDLQLGGNVGDDTRRHVGRVVQEGTEEADGTQLDGKAEAAGVAAVLIDELAISIIEMEIASELVRGRLASKAAIAAGLLGRQEYDGHGGALSAG